jgi:hypothetical protein
MGCDALVIVHRRDEDIVAKTPMIMQLTDMSKAPYF